MRKVFGIILIVIGAIIGLASLVSFFRVASRAFKLEGVNAVSFFIGVLLGTLITVGISVGLIYWGRKLTKKRPAKEKELLEQELMP